ncbi:MAG: hypothetical protein EHM79_02290 [Geobacter sp.]|nr:MAG: hypothetical protein EHM79_02290 [Geobacter sp.]
MSDTSQLATAEYNPRKISKERLALLRTQLAEFGDLSGIVFNIRTARLVGFPPGTQYAEKQVRIERDIAARFEAAVTEVLQCLEPEQI